MLCRMAVCGLHVAGPDRPSCSMQVDAEGGSSYLLLLANAGCVLMQVLTLDLGRLTPAS